jgi:hypothetical protein
VSQAVVMQAVQMLSTVIGSSQDQLSSRAVQAAQSTVDGVASSGAVTPSVRYAHMDHCAQLTHTITQ